MIYFHKEDYSCIILSYLQPFSEILQNSRSSRPEVFSKKVFLEITENSQEKTCDSGSFSCEFREISKNTFSYRAPVVATSEIGVLAEEI